MNDRLDQARQLGRRIDAGWQTADVEAQLARLHARRARRWRVAAPVMAAAAAAVIAAVTVAGVMRPGPGAAVEAQRSHAPAPPTAPAPVAVVPAPTDPVAIPPPVPAPAIAEAPAPPGVLSLGDGSVVTPLGKDSRLLARRVSETDVVVALVGSGARFDVPQRTARRFRAELGALALETHGAAFRVHVDRHQVEVAAERGEVRARIGQDARGAQVVAAGETRAFPIAAPDRTAGAAPDRAADVAAVDRGEPAAPSPPSWRDAAAGGDYAAAWAALGALRAPLDGMEDLLLAGDVARLSGHAGAAVAPLTRAVALHADDPRAPLAAFTLGRVHLEELGAPRDAALAFARARTLAPDGPLAEDALAREVEAWSRAGETQTARERATTYIQRYPQGRRVHAVRRFGGLERP
ncbi:MAG TPA: hypothetical protein VHW23_11830 [Kofleriaceae bacterium]|jgi:transmembrane sensor|nr:hypothetical protein [Kofleriaceae bacterium]